MPPEPEETWKNIAAIVGGAGASGLIASQVQKVAPQLTTEMAGGGAGVALILVGQRQRYPIVTLLGVGILAGALMPRIAGMISGIVPKATTGTQTTSEMTSAEQAAYAYVARSA